MAGYRATRWWLIRWWSCAGGRARTAACFIDDDRARYEKLRASDTDCFVARAPASAPETPGFRGYIRTSNSWLLRGNCTYTPCIRDTRLNPRLMAHVILTIRSE